MDHNISSGGSVSLNMMLMIIRYQGGGAWRVALVKYAPLAVFGLSENLFNGRPIDQCSV